MDDFTWWELRMFPRPHGFRNVRVVSRAASRVLLGHAARDIAAWDAELSR
jgi:hypothetical protein